MNSKFTTRQKHELNLKPFSCITPSIPTQGKFLLVLLLLHVVLLLAEGSIMPVITIFAATAASFSGELVFRKLCINYRGSRLISVLQGISVGLLVPQGYPAVSVFIITFVSLILGKYIFGVFSSSWVNPVAVTVAVLYMLNPEAFPPLLVSAETIRTKNAALSLIQNGNIPLTEADSTVTAFLNQKIFSFLGISVPEGYVSFFWDSGSVIPAFRFNFLSLVSSLILISFDVIDALIPAVFTLTYLVLVKLFAPVLAGGDFLEGDMLLSLLTSGTIFCTTFLLQWYGTAPLTKAGKSLYAFLAGCAAFFIIGAGTSSAGYVFTILMVNFLSPVISRLEDIAAGRKIRKNLLPKINVREEE